MRENLVKVLAAFFRSGPQIKGKYRVAKAIFNILKPREWSKPELWIKVNDTAVLCVDVRSGTHQIPFWTGAYDKVLIDKISGNVKDGWIILDIGANIGYYSLTLGCRLKDKIKVFAFEPEKNNFRRLEEGVRMNNLEETVLPIKVGLGEDEAIMDLRMNEEGATGNAFIVNENLKDEGFIPTEQIEIKKLDGVCEAYGINKCHFIKVDIEGAEIFFIRGAYEFIKRNRPIIYGEFNSFFLKRFGSGLKEVDDILRPLGYTCYKEQGRHSGKFELVKNVTDGINDVLYLPDWLSQEEIESWIN